MKRNSHYINQSVLWRIFALLGVSIDSLDQISTSCIFVSLVFVIKKRNFFYFHVSFAIQQLAFSTDEYMLQRLLALKPISRFICSHVFAFKRVIS